MPRRSYAVSSASTTCASSRASPSPLRPVLSSRATVPLPGPDTGRLRVVGQGARTAGAPGFGAGSPVLLGETPGWVGEPASSWSRRPSGTPTRSACCPTTSGAAGSRPCSSRPTRRVLVANRLPAGPDGPVPVLDEVPVAAVLSADRVAVEVAPSGHPLRVLTDPLAAEPTPSTSTTHDVAALVAAQLYDATHGVVLLGDHARVGGEPTGWASLRDRGRVAARRGPCRRTGGRGRGRRRLRASRRPSTDRRGRRPVDRGPRREIGAPGPGPVGLGRHHVTGCRRADRRRGRRRPGRRRCPRPWTSRCASSATRPRPPAAARSAPRGPPTTPSSSTSVAARSTW